MYGSNLYICKEKRIYKAVNDMQLKEKTKIILEALPCLLMIIIVIGGIIGGIFTATEVQSLQLYIVLYFHLYFISLLK